MKQQYSSTRRRRLVRSLLAAGTVGGVAMSTLVAVSPASAAIPDFPDNVVVFPDRDFVSVEGFSGHAGETATLTVTRGTTVMGMAKAEVSGTDVAFEVNHPGGVCWGAGAGANLQVTPDIIAGDVVSIAFPDGTHYETTTSGATVTEDMTLAGDTITVKGVLGDGNQARFEQRIIQPDLVDTAVGKRDIRALPGPLVPAARGGYSSGVAFDAAGNFTATYVFDDPANAAIAAAADLGERAMSWQVEDADGNRQGLTIAEFGEAGGPGMGGCPQGPGNQAAPAGTASVVRTGDTATVKWTPATPQPGAEPVTGYSVEAIDTAGAVRGLRLGAAATQTTLTGLGTGQYTFEVRSMAGAGMSVPFAPAQAGPVDTTVPTLTLSPAPTANQVTEANSVSVNSNGQVFFTTDGSPVVSGNSPSDSAQLYSGPIPVTAPITLRVAAFDDAGNILVEEGQYRPVSVALPTQAPTGLTGIQTQNSVALNWNASTEASVTGYQVNVYNAQGVKLATQPPVTSVARQTITGLTPGTTYQFGVQAKNAAGLGPESAKLTRATDASTDRVTITSARWKAGDFRVVGTGSEVGRTVQVYRVNADGSRGAAIAGATAAVTAAAPPGIGDYTVRLRNGQPTSNPGRIFVVSSGGGVAGPFTVSNG